jgi:hypothetical protein
MSARFFVAHGDNGSLEGAIEINLSDEIDARDELLADDVGATLEVARRFLVILDRSVERARIEGAMKLAADLIGIILQRCKNREARDWGLAFAFGFASRLNGVRDEAHAARQLNCTRALLSRYKRQFDKLLPEDVRVYGKSAQACAAYLDARLAKLGYRQRESNDEHERTGISHTQRPAT